MAEYAAKSIIIGRKKMVGDHYPMFINLFDVNEPHIGSKVPKEFLEFPCVEKLVIKGLDVSYLPFGNDILIDDLEKIEIKERKETVYLTGVQSKQQ